MSKRVLIGVSIILGIAIVFSVWKEPMSVLDLLKPPLQSLWGSPQRLQTGVLDVSENVDSIQEATRRLLKPFGVVQIIRRFPALSASENSDSRRKP